MLQIHAIQGHLFVNDSSIHIGVLPLLQESFAHPNDIFILNYGLWHGDTHRQRVQGHHHAIGQLYNSTKHKFPHVFWMETPKQHFDSEDGDFQVSCRPLGGPRCVSSCKSCSVALCWSAGAC